MDKIIARSSHRHRIFFAVLAALVLLSIIFFSSHRANADAAVISADEHIITLHDSGVDKGFITKKATLREALADQHIRVDAKDLTEPGLDDKLVASSYQVNIYRARPVAIHDGKVETKVITAYRTTGQIAKEANITLHDEDITKLAPSTEPLADGAAEVMTITRATGFTFDFYGKLETAYTQAKTVGDMLKEKHITMGPKDGLSVAVSTPITTGMSIRIWRDGVQTVTQDEDVAFDTKTVQDADQPISYKQVQTPGAKGKRTVTYEIIMQNGVEVSRREINSITTQQPVQEVMIVGSKLELPAGSHTDWMRQAGVDPSDYGYVNLVFTGESHWNTNSVNPTGCGGRGCYGLGQTNIVSLSSACPNWQSDPICQIQFFSGYAVNHGYGSWRAAAEFWSIHHWW